MAEVVVSQNVVLKVTDAEWRLIMRALAIMAGVKIKVRSEDERAAEALNKQLLGQRVNVLRGQLEVAEKALLNAPESEDPDGSAVVAKMAYSVGRQVERELAKEDE